MSSGLEALIDIASIKPDILITDLDMPGVDGFELLRTLRQNPQFHRMTSLVLSALTSEVIESRGGLPEGCISWPSPSTWIGSTAFSLLFWPVGTPMPTTAKPYKLPAKTLEHTSGRYSA